MIAEQESASARFPMHPWMRQVPRAQEKGDFLR